MGNRLNIFISYRRVDSYDFSGRMHDRLAQEFDVFFDKEGGIGTGEEFPLAIQNGIKKADVVLMVIGKRCCDEFKAKEGTIDFVVEEIALAKASGCYIIPVLMEGVEFPSCLPERIEFISAHNAFEFGRNSFSLYMDRLIKDLKNLPKKQKRDFVKEVIDELERERLLVLFSQDFTSIDGYLEDIKRLLVERFNQQLYLVSVPSFLEDEEEYFGCIAKDSGLSCQSKKANDWYQAMRERLRSNPEPILLLVTDLEDGNEQLDRQLATRLRSLKEEFASFYTICVGRKALAKLVYGEGYLSPLNNAKELFFPEDSKKLSEERIVQQFNSLGKDLNLLCKYLKREELGRFAPWSYNELIRTLFWKNLLVKKNRKFVWRDELTREIGREVLGCDEDMV